MNIFYFKTPDESKVIKQNPILDYVFWSLLILFTDPGGIIEALGIYYISGKVNYSDIIFVLLSVCYFLVPKTQTLADQTYQKAKIYLIIFLAYFYLFYVIIIPIYNHIDNYSLFTGVIKTRRTLYNIALFIYIYEFFKRRWDIFFKVFLFSSIAVMTLYLQARMTGINLLPVNIMNRQFVNIDRNLMVNEGLMPLLIPLGVVILVFKIKSKYKFWIIAGFMLMSAVYLFELWRRNLIAIFAFFMLAIIIDSYIRHNSGRLLLNAIKVVVLLFVISVSLYLISPKYTKAAYKALIETVSVVKSSKTTQGQSDVRLTLNRPFINNLFYKSPIWGTGFDNRWRNHEGDLQGYEAADYPFLAALAMFGLLGIIIFGPVYILLIKVIKSDLQYYRTHKNPDKNTMQLLALSFILFFIYQLMQYFNYFNFISVSDDFINYFFLSLYLSSRSKYYNSELAAQHQIEYFNTPESITKLIGIYQKRI